MTTSLLDEVRVDLFSGNDAGAQLRRHQPLVARRQATWLALFCATFAATLIAIAWLSLISRRQTFETGAAQQVWQLGPAAFEAQFAGRLPENCVVGCSGFELTGAASPEEVLREAGRSWIDADCGIVRWSLKTEGANSPSNGAIPIAVLVVPGTFETALGKKTLLFWIPAVILALAGTMLALGNSFRSDMARSLRLQTRLEQARRAFSWSVPGASTGRIVLVFAVGVGLAFTLVPDWNRLVTCPDSRSYVENLPIRTPLTAGWIAAFDSERHLSRVGSLPPERRTIAHWGPSQRYVTAARAWKLLFVASVCVFAWCLTSIIPWWMAASLILAAAAWDGSRGLWSTGMSGYLDVLLSEPLSYSLLLLLLASLCAYFSRPGWIRGLAIALCLNLLILGRPASLAFVSVIGCVWLFHWRREGLFFACRRCGVLALITVSGILMHCTVNLAQYGHFRQHAFTGMNMMTTALQVADADDATAFSDPKLARFAQLAIDEALARRQSPFCASAADENCWKCAVPAFVAVYGVQPQDAPFAADEVLTQAARTLIRRHPREFLRQAANSFWEAFGHGWICVPLLLTCVAGVWVYRRSGDWRLLFVAYLAALPLISILPCCLLNFPLERYQSVTSFAEVWSLPLLIGVVVAHSMNRSRAMVLNRECDRGGAPERVSLAA